MVETSNTLVEIRDLAKGYTRGGQIVPVLEGITLNIARGDFIALMGPSGVGKSLLLRAIVDLDPSIGNVTIRSRSRKPSAPSTAAAS